MEIRTITSAHDLEYMRPQRSRRTLCVIIPPVAADCIPAAEKIQKATVDMLLEGGGCANSALDRNAYMTAETLMDPWSMAKHACLFL